MKKKVSVLVLVGILSSTFIGCGFNSEVKSIANEEGVITYNNETKEELDSKEFNNNLERLVEEDDIKSNGTEVLKEPTRIELVVSRSLIDSSRIELNDYKLTPDEALDVFYRKDPKGLRKQEEVSKFLMDKYEDASLETFIKHRKEVDENIKNVVIYMTKPKKTIEPFVFIGKTPIYAFDGWLGDKTTLYINYRGDAEAVDSLKLACESGYLFRVKDGKKVKVIEMPNINSNESITWDE